MHAYFVSQLSEALQVSLYSSRLVMQSIANGIETSNFLRAFFANFLEFFIRGINEINTTHFQALSSFGFSIAHFCFSLRFDASDISFQIPGHKESGLEVVCFLVSLLRDNVYPSSVFSSNIVNHVKPVHVSDNSRPSSTFQFVALSTWMYFSGIGNDASLGTSLCVQRDDAK